MICTRIPEQGPFKRKLLSCRGKTFHNIGVNLPVYAASYQLLNHLAFKDSSLMGRFGLVEYAPTTVIMIMIMIMITIII